MVIQKCAWRSAAAFAVIVGVGGCTSIFTSDCADELSVHMDPSDTTIAVGQQFTEHVSLTTCGGTRRVADSFTWRSDDPTVVTVDRDTGLVTAIGVGQTSIVLTGARLRDLARVHVTVK